MITNGDRGVVIRDRTGTYRRLPGISPPRLGVLADRDHPDGPALAPGCSSLADGDIAVAGAAISCRPIADDDILRIGRGGDAQADAHQQGGSRRIPPVKIIRYCPTNSMKHNHPHSNSLDYEIIGRLHALHL
ncbi:MULTISPECIES: hypothetical protein [unclassified Chelatococcus]|uniref:hypothetical protein n=1 Tax=unclassified Chelatococcus TaxID=2638111 RepID=UPI0018D1A1CB|nr:MULTISPECIES: hypothetical protein [unclassified Chelatococcus]